MDSSSRNEEKRSRGNALVGTALTLALIAAILAGGKLALFAWSPGDATHANESYLLVHKGEPAASIIRDLEKAGAVRDPWMFMWLGRLTHQWSRIKAGEYKVSGAMSPTEIFASLRSGISVAHPLTVREGENMYEIAADLESKGLATSQRFLELCKSPAFIATAGVTKDAPSLEGYLYPETYFFNRTMTPEDMIREMVGKFRSLWTTNEDAASAALGMTKHQVVTLASMIEKETGAQQERPIISSVFHNRLRKHMRLQSDPTTIYGIWTRYKGNISRADLLTPTAYNTYTIPALPPGPIANPGKEAIHAALFPAETTYLFFVSHNDGTHQFSGSLAEHNSAVHRFQVDPKARVGKSWRDLRKKKAQ